MGPNPIGLVSLLKGEILMSGQTDTEEDRIEVRQSTCPQTPETVGKAPRARRGEP